MTSKGKTRSIVSGFVNSAKQVGERPALVVRGGELTYSELSSKAGSIAASILKSEQDPFPLAALLAHRSVTAYAAVLGILGSGKGYVPLNPKFPLERTRSMLLLSGCNTLVVGGESLSQLPDLLTGFERCLTVILPDTSNGENFESEFPHCHFVFSDEISPTDDFSWRTEVDSDAIASLMFTSGSTGVPKGVPIHHANVQSYVQYISDRYQVSERDRFSQEFDLTFDLSAHDMFVCWERGACLYPVPERSTMAPTKFIREHELTMWFSVPSVVGLLSRMKLLTPNCFPSLRYSLFCGEPLSAEYAQLWQQAAPNSAVENLYGPTETTIAITHYRWDVERSPAECVNGIVPIGWPFANQNARVIGEGRMAVPTAEWGELCLAGSQVTTGYWNNPEKTREQFIHLPDAGDLVWYRTGDMARIDERGCLFFLGRIDHQVKIRGYRVELQEVEAVLRKICETDQVVSLAWPVHNGSAEGIVAFISGVNTLDPERVLNSCSELLPAYMVPKRLYTIDELPLNANGKIDRPRLSRLIEEIQA